jgi:hypothetical protein
MTTQVRSGSRLATGRQNHQPGCGGGVLAVVLDLSAAGFVINRAAELACPGAAPLTVLAQVRRPLAAVAFPLGPVGPYWTDDELMADARKALSVPMRTLARLGGVDLKFAFWGIEKAAAGLLRERDYAQVVIGSRSSGRQRRQCRRVESAASPYCTVDVL